MPEMNGENQNGVITAKAAKSYREEHVSGLSQKELILMLYDGAIKFCAGAKQAIEEKNYIESHRLIIRARNIVLELLRILDVNSGGEIAKNLQRLYVYMIGRLIEVNFTKETRLLDNVLMILQDLRSAWAQIDFDEALAAIDLSSESAQNPSRSPNFPQHPTNSARLLSVTA